MPTLTPDIEFVLSCVADYRAVGCRWSVIAWRMEMTTEEVRAFEREYRDELERRVERDIRERQREDEARRPLGRRDASRPRNSSASSWRGCAPTPPG